jgi:hypothetical protein
MVGGGSKPPPFFLNYHRVANYNIDSPSIGDHRPLGRDRIRSQPKNLKIGRDQKIGYTA